MQLKFRFFQGIAIGYIISKKTPFCCVYENICYGPIVKMLLTKTCAWQEKSFIVIFITLFFYLFYATLSSVCLQ